MITGGGGNTAAFITAKRRGAGGHQARQLGPGHPRQGEDGHRQAGHPHHQHAHARRSRRQQRVLPGQRRDRGAREHRANMEKMPAFQDAANKHGLARPDLQGQDDGAQRQGRDRPLLLRRRPTPTATRFVVFRNLRIMHAGDVFANKGRRSSTRTTAAAAWPTARRSPRRPRASRTSTPSSPATARVMTWQDFVDYGEFNRLFLEHARASMKAGRTAEEAMKTLQAPRQVQGLQPRGRPWRPGGQLRHDLRGAEAVAGAAPAPPSGCVSRGRVARPGPPLPRPSPDGTESLVGCRAP